MVGKAAALLYSVVSPVSRILCKELKKKFCFSFFLIFYAKLFFFLVFFYSLFCWWMAECRPSQSERSGTMRQFLARGDSGRCSGYLFGRILWVYHLAWTDGHPVTQVITPNKSVRWIGIHCYFLAHNTNTGRVGWHTLIRKHAAGVGDLFRSRRRPWTPVGSYCLLFRVKLVRFRQWPWLPITSDSVAIWSCAFSAFPTMRKSTEIGLVDL
jgi:hypothetical protein